MNGLIYAIKLTTDDNGTVLITCPDIPEVSSSAEDETDARLRALDAIEEAIAARITHKEPIPMPSQRRARHRVALPAQIAIKALLHNRMHDTGMRKADLARALKLHGPQIDRLLNINHASKLEQLEAAVQAVGQRLVVGVEESDDELVA